ncbi:putative amidohydrolase YtcJ [Amphiura filiformis]|uniref:putative amidohydrolase YtcJ n=1 Tax=Amphiura filiformis TaxID=82378 RepID=UPI003B20D89F
MLDTIESIRNDPKPRWGTFFGWDPELISDLPILSKKFLDDNFATDVAIGVIGQSGHVAWANSKAFADAGVDESIEDANGGVFVRDGDGKLTGQLFEEPAIMRVMAYVPLPSAPEILKAIKDQNRYYASVGITTVTDLAYMPNEALDSALKLVFDKEDAPSLYRVEHPSKNEASSTNKTQKAVKSTNTIAACCPHLGFAAATQYKNQRQGGRYCHGERACEQVLRAYEQVLVDDPTNRCRHRMEHLGLMTVEQIARAGKVNIGLSFFVDHLRFYASVYKTDLFGEERVNRLTPLSEATKNGVTWTIHQDHPTYPGDADPFANMKTAITRTQRDDPTHPYGPEYCATIDEVLKAYTINAAWQLNLDAQLGSITVGKKADLVVLTENPYHKDPFKLEDIKVVETFLSGRRNNFAKMYSMGPGLNVMK